MSDDLSDIFIPSLPNPPDIKAEPDDVKAARLLANLREFVASEHNLTGFEVDGQRMYLLKFDALRHRVEPDAAVQA